MSEVSSSIARQRVGAFWKRACRKNALKHSYTVECGNRLRVKVRAQNPSVSGFVCRPFKGMLHFYVFRVSGREAFFNSTLRGDRGITIQTNLNLHNPVWAGSKGSHHQREGTILISHFCWTKLPPPPPKKKYEMKFPKCSPIFSQICLCCGQLKSLPQNLNRLSHQIFKICSFSVTL